ncbi:uncharacterized protein LOC133288019 [Gastrolobium bilobum]|uniref:uncharacterized protein LOC133288019 n=1 Tax=Gastrolobium bilobum TaxID=150636 RepID=UPI002AAFC81A|nr:uncharacterized protein LOC133288019 [Gastrolobium bilobum]
MADNNVLQNPRRTLGDYMTPTRVPQTASIVRLAMDANNVIQKDQFAGGSTKDPYTHLEKNLLYCDTLKMNGVSRDAIFLRLFPCSLKEEARGWLRSLPEGSITNWDDFATKFLARFFSASKMARLKADISAFEQKESESLYEAWERFKGLLRKCPHHGIKAWEKARIFFQGMTPSTRTLVNAAAGGLMLPGKYTDRTKEALELLESLASQEFDNAPAPQRRAGIMKLEGYDAILVQNEQMLQFHKKQQEQLDALTKQFANSQVSSTNSAQITCGICAGAHATEDCNAPETKDVNGVWYDQKNQNNQGRNQNGNNYNPGWINPNQHPGFSYKSNHQLNPSPPVQQQPPQSEWEKLSRQFTERAHGTFSSNTVVNPREHCNAITTRSGTVIQPIEEQPEEKKKDGEASVEEEKEEKAKDTIEVDKSNPEKPEKKLFKWEKKKALERQDKPFDLSPYARILYPQRLKKEIQKQQCSKFLDIFRRLQINIPFAEALENMPNYARFMKDLLSRKRKLRECETINLTEECNAISEKKLPTKVKDPGSFSIPCTIGKVEVDNKLGITEVKPTTTTVQMADRSSKQAYGIIEDILVKVVKFIIPVDFVILDIEEDAIIPMIFGRPFLATSGALIDVLKGELILRVDGEQATFKFFDKEVPSFVAQPKDQVYYIGEKKGEDEHDEESSQESKPKVKMEKPDSKGKHVKVKFKVPETTLPHPYAEEHYGRTQFTNDGPWSSPSSYFEPP